MKKLIIFIIAVVVVTLGLIKVNIKNTVSLSPVGNFEDNFNKVSEEFGEDFSDFIMDKSPVKIYLGEIGDDAATVKVLDKDINLTKDNPFLKIFKPIANIFKAGYERVYNWINNIDDNSEKIDETKETNSEIDGIVDEFINSIEGE